MNRLIIISSCTIAALMTLVLVQAGYFFLVPHDKYVAPEVGLIGAFVLFSLIYVISFFIAIMVFEGSMLREGMKPFSWARVLGYSGILLIISSGLLMLANHGFSLKTLALVAVEHAIPSFLYVALRTRVCVGSKCGT